MFRHLKSVSMMLFLLGAPFGIAYATAAPSGPYVAATQQNGNCTGVVKDATGETIIGASVVVKGTTNGTITGIDGDFALQNVKQGDIIQVSFVGYITQEVKWTGRPLNITLQDDTQTLEEVVVTAYGGRQLRSKVTNSIAKVDDKTLSSGIHSNPAQALAGAVAGLRVQMTDGDPGATPTIVLRGGTNLDGSGSPLIIVDGAQRDLSDINPADIESMEVLKDAGATAIYGARAANGVVLVTTKRGKEGYSTINVKAKIGLNYYHDNYNFLSARDYLYWMRTAYQRSANYWTDSAGNGHGSTTMSSLSGATPYGTGNIYFNADGTVADGNKVSNANWSTMVYTDDLKFLLDKGWQVMDDPVYDQQLIFKEFQMRDVNIQSPALSQDYMISLTGGNDKGSYYSSLGYNNSEGNAVGNWYKRFTWTFNGDYKIRPWLTSNSSFNFSHNTWYGMVGGAAKSSYFSRVMSVPPTFRGTNEDGEYLIGVRGTTDANQLLLLDAYERDNNTNKFTMTQSFNINFMKGLDLKLSGSWYYQDTKYESFNHDYMTGVNTWNTTRSSSDEYERTLNETYNAVLNFNRTFARKHNVSAMVGVEYYNKSVKGFYASGYGAPTDDFQDLSLTQEDGRSIDSWHYKERILSFFGKVDYDYEGKYLFSGVIRKDGYSRLAKDNRWGVFPGVSAGWVISKENFFTEQEKLREIISFAKLRASYGANGNIPTSSIGYYTVQGAYATTTSYNQNSATLLSTLPNPGLLWEKSYTFEIGLDMGFFENKYNLNMTYYSRTTKDKIASITLPSHSGTSSYLSNNGEVRNRGFEFEFTGKIINTKDWNWTLQLNGAYNKNKIISLPDNGLERNRQSAMQVYSGNGDDKIWVGGYQEGQEPGAIYGFLAEGLYKSYDEIPGNLTDITSGNNGANGRTLYGPTAWAALSDAEKANGYPIQPGDVKWKDVNGDGVIDDYDQVKLGNSRPRWTGGIVNTVTWKGLTFTARFDYALGYKVIDTKTPWILGNMQGTFNTVDLVFDTWTEDNVNAKYPTYVWADQLGKRNYARNNNSLFVYNGDYLAIRELSLSYSLPKSWIEKLKMEKLELSISAQNLGYITAAKNMASPEYGADSWGGYSLPRTLIFGLNINF